MTRFLVTPLLIMIAGCGNLPTEGDGVVALEITGPTSMPLPEGATRQLIARAYDQTGAEVAADIAWSTADTTVSVTAQGLVTALVGEGIGRVQASVGNLRSNLITFTLQP